MSEQFYTILTSIGKAKIANASALGNKVNFTHFALGDGGGKYYSPTENQEKLINEVWRGQIGQISIDEKNPNWIVIETIIPADQGGFMIREAGIFDEEGNLLAIGKYPETYKPVVADGSAKDLYIRMILEVVNTSVVNLKVDPGVILATKKDIEVLEQKMNDIPVVEIIDNLTTEDATKALSTKQGKILQDAKMDKGGGTFTGNVDMAWKNLSKSRLSNYVESATFIGAGSSASVNSPLAFKSLVINLERNYTIRFAPFDRPSQSGSILSGTIIINQSSTPYSVTFLADSFNASYSRLVWQNGEIPFLNSPDASYVITYMTYDNGGTYYLFYGGEFYVS
ncbi:phage tail protein [Tissierellaceae bacterium HCP3S3_D8]